MKDKIKPITKKKEATPSKKLKQLAIEQLREMPLVTYTCQKFSIPKSTFYKWKLIDKDFKSEVENAINMGRETVNDIAISQLLKKINNGETVPIIFWLKNNSPMFNEKVTLEIKNNQPGLSPEEVEVISKALVKMGFETTVKKNGKLNESFLKHMKMEADEMNSKSEYRGDRMVSIADIVSKIEEGRL